MKYLFAAGVLALAACGAPVSEDEPAIVTELVGEEEESEAIEEPPALEQCDAADYRPMIGTSIAEASFPDSERLRVFGETDIITQEYLPQRTNVVYGIDGLIARVYCG